MSGRKSIELAVVSSGQRAQAWHRQIEDRLTRTGNLSGSPMRADAVVVVIDGSFPASMQRARETPDGCFESIREALAAGKMLLPVTVEGAAIPDPGSLPEGIRALTRFQGVAVDREADLPGVAARLVMATRTMARTHVPAKAEGRRVFISYRREDSWYWASLLARALTQRLGADHVFFDIGSIAPGRRFDVEIQSRIRSATDFVILVGPAFVAPGPDGRSRLEDPDDFVRREITTALEDHKPIQIVLAGDAALPAREGLPDGIARAFEGAVRHLTDYRDADGVAGAILRTAPQSGAPHPPRRSAAPPAGTPRVPPWLPAPEASSLLTERQKSERFLMAAVPPLAALGWWPADQALGRGAVVMTRPDDEPYRFVFDFEHYELVLQERARSLGGLGVKRWIKRAKFPISPDAVDIDVLRPPARQVEAMENPAAYLERTGRVDLDSAPRPPMSAAQLDSFLRLSSQPARRALDGYAHEQARIRARGGLRVLRCIRRISLGGDAHAVATNPVTRWFAAATDQGAWVFDPQGAVVEPTPLEGNIECLAFSSRGMLAVADDKHRLSVLDQEGAVIVGRRSPYSAWRRATGTRTSFKTLSWSPDGERIAVGAADRIWVYDLDADAFEPVALQQDGQGVVSAAALFGPGSDDLWIMHLSTVWRVSRGTGETLGQLDLGAGSEFWDAASGAPSSRPTGLRPICLAASPGGERLAIGGKDAQLVFIDGGTLRPVGMRVWHAPLVDGRLNGEIEALSFSPDGGRIVSVANDHRLVVGDVESGDSLADGILHRESAWQGVPVGRDVCWSVDGSRIAVANGEGSVEIWDGRIGPTDRTPTSTGPSMWE